MLPMNKMLEERVSNKISSFTSFRMTAIWAGTTFGRPEHLLVDYFCVPAFATRDMGK
jgi:hypothetical protein